MIRKTIGTAAITAAFVALTSCSTNTSPPTPEQTTTTTTTATAATVTTTTRLPSSTQPTKNTEVPPATSATPNYEPSDAQIAAFTTAFRTQFPALSTGRRDNSIASVLENSCQEISVGKDEQNLLRNAGMRAAYQDTSPTNQQATEILALVRAHCPAA